MSLFAGIAFIAIGIYFLSAKFSNKLLESNPDKDEKSQRRMVFRAKGSGYTALSIGALTIMWGIMIFTFPQTISVLALIYMILLIIAFSVISFVFK